MLPLSLNTPEYWQGFTHGLMAYTVVLVVVWALCGWLSCVSSSEGPE